MSAASEFGLQENNACPCVWPRVVLGLALVLGLLRFWRLGEWSLWFDEAATWTDAGLGLSGGETHNPLGYQLIAGTVKLLGGVPNEFALRLLPAVCGWLVIPLAYIAFRPFAGAAASAGAALIVSVSSWQVYWSQNARFYTMAQLVSLAGAALLMRGLARGSVLRTLCGAALAAAGALFHPSAALFVPPLVLLPWLFSPERFEFAARARRPLLVLLALGAAGLLWKAGWLWQAWQDYRRQKANADPAHLVLTAGFYVTPLLGAAALAGAVLSFKRGRVLGMYATGLCASVLVIALVLSNHARISAQYVFVLLPWIALLAALPVCELACVAAPRWISFAWLALLAAPALTTCLLYFTVRKGERPEWREAYEFVWNRREEDDLVLGMEATVGEFYLAPLATDLRNTTHVAWLDKWRASEPRAWARHARRTWYIFNPEQLLEWDAQESADFQKLLREECRLVKCYPLYVESRDLSVWVYVRG